MIGLVVIMFSVGIYLTITDRDDSDESGDFWTGFHWFMNSLFNDKLVPIITTIVWVGGMEYMVTSLYTFFNDNEVQEVIIPKTVDEKYIRENKNFRRLTLLPLKWSLLLYYFF